MLTDEQAAEIEMYRSKKWRRTDIAKVTGIAIYLVSEHFENNPKQKPQEQPRSPDPTPEEIAAACAVLKTRQLAEMASSPSGRYYERMPRHYCVVSELR